ncbi:MAG: hypothetical protein K6G65_05800 [Lachnospiraceae bacterium]|nr:hypothetical protein [Lachnospiraceae bacterium]
MQDSNADSSVVTEENQIEVYNEEYHYDSFNLKITNARTGEYNVPNPEKVSGVADVNIRKFCEDDYLDEASEYPVCDFSYLGLNGRTHVVEAKVGNVTGSGESLVLELFKENDNPKEDYEPSNVYIAVIDYLSKVSYVLQTDCHYRVDDMVFNDITGDGVEDIIISGIPNKGLRWNLISFDNNELVCIYSNNGESNLENDNYTLTMEDNYKLLLQSKYGSFKKEISLLDIGLKKEYLEYEEIEGAYDAPDPEDEEPGVMWNLDSYQDGKVRKERRDYLRVAFLDCGNLNETRFKYASAKEGIQLNLDVEYGELKIGEVKVTLKYNKEKKSLYVANQELNLRELSNPEYW